LLLQIFSSPDDYLFNLHTCSPGEAKKIWKLSIKESFDNKCAYCGSRESLTLDHLVPRYSGGTNEITNLVCACFLCNRDKAHDEWQQWYQRQDFYDPFKEERILKWQKPNKSNYEDRAGVILTRNNFIYKKLKHS
jgi:5-methylcytosine-specific restriction endonuclease McrA